MDDVAGTVDDEATGVELVETDAAPVRGGEVVLVVDDTTAICPCPVATVVEGTGAVVGEAPDGATVVGDETGGVLVVADGATDVELVDDELEDVELEEVVFTDVSIVTTPALTVVAGPVLVEESVTEFAVSSTMTVPSDAQVTPKARTDDVDEADGEKTHEDAVPELLKSPAEIPDTCSLNITE